MKRIYIASPYTQGDVGANVSVQLRAANDLMDEGFAVYAPLLSHFQHIYHPRPYDDWLRHCLIWVEMCNAVLRLPGYSPGADKEVEHARMCCLPVFSSIEQVIKHFRVHNADMSD